VYIPGFVCTSDRANIMHMCVPQCCCVMWPPLVLYVPSDRANIMHMCVPQYCCAAECTQQLVSLSLRSIVFDPQLHVHCHIHAFFLSVKQDISPLNLRCTFSTSFLGFKVQNFLFPSSGEKKRHFKRIRNHR
jgi:hypothetical protein